MNLFIFGGWLWAIFILLMVYAWVFCISILKRKKKKNEMEIKCSCFCRKRSVFLFACCGYGKRLLTKKQLSIKSQPSSQEPHLQYHSKVSWQSRLETRFSILKVFKNRESSFEARVSRIEFRGSSFKFRGTWRIFRGSRTEISRKRFNSQKQNNSDEQNNWCATLFAQTCFDHTNFYHTKSTWHIRILTCGW